MNKSIRPKIIYGLKIIIAAISSILIALLLKLDFAISAGIVAILSVQPTKKETLKTALSRFYAFILAILISFTTYNFIGFNNYAFFVYIIIFVAICQFFEFYSAMAMDSVLISHFLSYGKMGFYELKNEFLLFIIGVGMGIIMNLFLRKNRAYIEELKNTCDDQIKNILHRMSLRILDQNLQDYDGQCFTKLDQAIFQAEKIAEENYNNQFRKNDIFDREYILMRKKQKNVLFEIYKILNEIKTVPSTAKTVSEFFEKISLEYDKNNDVGNLIEELKIIQEGMKKTALPVERKEFEDRAQLFMMLKRLKEFLSIKRDFYLEHINN
ncbi:MAG: hypothetical protein K5866_05535 [Treponema sp.]|nr:hypothetical protein [Treponema sp.]